MTGSDIVANTMIAVGFAAIAALLTFVIIAIAQAVRADIGYPYTVMWVAAIVLFPVVGPIAWYLLGDRTRALERAIGSLTAHTRP
ncbi:MAG: hypothetical protein QOF36_1727 [Microbacteriaceae bacterium]|jgi:uncharacterized membrane protein YphA (DoxX/SURF4 family)|nr:hypothetical protein [Microbacteriaceae bacterium]